MKKEVKVKPLSRLDKQGLEIAAQGKDLQQLGYQMNALQRREDKQDALISRELFAIREAFQLTDEWRNRALKAEHALSLGAAQSWDGDLSKLNDDELKQVGEAFDKICRPGSVKFWQDQAAKAQILADEANKSLKYAQDTLDQFKREDEARALAIRGIVRPLGFDLFAPMDAVRAMAKLTFSLRDEVAAQMEKINYITIAAEEWEKRAKLVEGKFNQDTPTEHADWCAAKPPQLGLCSCWSWRNSAKERAAYDRGWAGCAEAIKAAEEKSNLDKPAAQEDKPVPDCHCIKWYGVGYFETLNFDTRMVDILPGVWKMGRAVCFKDCKDCGGTGYRRKDSPSPPDAAQSMPDSVYPDVSRKASIEEVMKIYRAHPGGQIESIRAVLTHYGIEVF